jgi:hypothetical protein
MPFDQSNCLRPISYVFPKQPSAPKLLSQWLLKLDDSQHKASPQKTSERDLVVKVGGGLPPRRQLNSAFTHTQAMRANCCSNSHRRGFADTPMLVLPDSHVCALPLTRVKKVFSPALMEEMTCSFVRFQVDPPRWVIP